MFDESKTTWIPAITRRSIRKIPYEYCTVASGTLIGTPAYLHVKTPEDVTMVERPRRCQQFLAWVELDGHRYLDSLELPINSFAAALGLPGGQSVQLTYPDHTPAKALVIVTQDELVKTDVNEQFTSLTALFLISIALKLRWLLAPSVTWISTNSSLSWRKKVEYWCLSLRAS